MLPDNAEDLLVVRVVPQAGYVVGHACGAVLSWDLAFDVYLTAIWLHRQVDQEARVAWLAQSNSGGDPNVAPR
jgi:hypothetical protein